MDDEPSLDFFSHASRDHHDGGKDQGIAAAAQHVLERIVSDVVQVRRDPQDDQQHDHREHEGCRKHRNPEERLAEHGAVAKQHRPGLLMVCPQEEEHQADDECRIDQRQREDERRRQPAGLGQRVHAEPAQNENQENLRGVTGADDDFHQRGEPLEGQHPLRLGKIRELRKGLVHRRELYYIAITRDWGLGILDFRLKAEATKDAELGIRDWGLGILTSA